MVPIHHVRAGDQCYPYVWTSLREMGYGVLQEGLIFLTQLWQIVLRESFDFSVLIVFSRYQWSKGDVRRFVGYPAIFCIKLLIQVSYELPESRR